MKLNDVITRVDKLCENEFEPAEKVRWLSVLDGLIWKNVMKPHDADETFGEYDWAQDQDTELLVPFPFDELYIYWVESKIYLAHKEIDLYNNAAELYGKFYADFSRWWNREHPTPEPALRFKNYRME